MDSQNTLTVTTTTRPKRIAFFVHEENLTNDEINGIINFNCRHWGGRFNPIIPTSGAELKSDWWNLLIAVDPDIIYSFVNLADALVDRINRHVLPSRIFEINPGELRPKPRKFGLHFKTISYSKKMFANRASRSIGWCLSRNA